jgi:hypothetical protein
MARPINLPLPFIPRPGRIHLSPVSPLIVSHAGYSHTSFLIEIVNLLVLTHHEVFLLQSISELLIPFFHFYDTGAVAIRVVCILGRICSFELYLVDGVQKDKQRGSGHNLNV